MVNKRHLFLKNTSGTCYNFNHQRGRESNNDVEEQELNKDYSQQKETLFHNVASFLFSRRARLSNRSISDLPHYDLLTIHFLKNVDIVFSSFLEYTYGIRAIRYQSFNKDVTFLILDAEKFQNTFLANISRFYNTENKNIAPDKNLTTISHFEYHDTNEIVGHLQHQGIKSHIEVQLLNDNILTRGTNIDLICKKLYEYIEQQGIHYTKISNEVFQVDNISNEIIYELANNFDIITAITQSQRRQRVIPDRFNGFFRTVDFDIKTRNNLPVIGVLDTGTANVYPLLNILEDGDDLTGDEAPFTVSEEHGTTVASLASFGINYFKLNKDNNEVNADAKIYTIKVLSHNCGSLDIARIKSSIEKANDKGIRIFNLSLTASYPKRYNEDFSIFAYILDILAAERDLLIFISTGNIEQDDVEAMQDEKNSTSSLTIKQFLKYPYHFYNPKVTSSNTYMCEMSNLSSPAESMNNVTVGALAENCRTQLSDLSLGKKFPAYYTKKYYVDYNQEINGTPFNRNQINKNIFKPDIVMPGGDVLTDDSKMQVIGTNGYELNFFLNSGTSYAAPLAANLAAKILYKYPDLKMQSVKALIINSSSMPGSAYLAPMIENLKKEEASVDDISSLSSGQKKNLSRKYNADLLNKYLTGYGMPNLEKCLFSNEKNVTFIIEDKVHFDSYKVINLNIPTYLYNHPKSTAITIIATLCFRFKPVFGDALSYNPIHISFNFGNSMNHDDPNKNAKEYATNFASDDDENMRIKSHFFSWSDDFYPASSKRFSNVQKVQHIISGQELRRINGQISIIVRCTGRNTYILKNKDYDFSMAISLEENRCKELEDKNLYDEISEINDIDIIDENTAEDEIDIE